MAVPSTPLERLFSYFARPPGYQARGDDDELLQIQARCKELFEKDYNISIIPNRNGEMCATYPLDLIIMESSKYGVSSTGVPSKVNDKTKLEPLLLKGRFARVRARFPVPVILWNNKNVCRSSTLAQKAEYMLQTAHNQVKNQLLYGSSDSITLSDTNNMEGLRNMDIGIIKQLSVKYIVDLMMENKKKKFGFSVCSSEKVDMHDRYAPFAIASIPYPGVEFFQEFNQRKHVANDLHFDWDKPADYVQLKVDHIDNNIMVPWAEYKTWDLIVLTQNYLKLMLQFISDGAPSSGLLVHCISGWDRTPLFISLLRISLWADGEIHQSLNAEEMLYLTVAYDWLLFSHQLSDRTSRGEDIFYFCFYFLQFITATEFSVKPQTPTTPIPAAKSPNPQAPQSSLSPPSSPFPSFSRSPSPSPSFSPSTPSPSYSLSPSPSPSPSRLPSSFRSDSSSSSSSAPPRKLSNGNKYPSSYTHPTPVSAHSFSHNTHIHAPTSRSMPIQFARGGDGTAPIDVPGRHHARKVSDGSCGSVDDTKFGSWQMMEMSLTDKYINPSPIGSFYDPTLVSPRRLTSPPLQSAPADDSISDSSSSRDFEQFSDHSVSWEHEVVFPHDQDGSSPIKPTSTAGKQFVETSIVELDKATRRALLLTQLAELGIAHYKQCCMPHQLQANNWVSQGLWRLLPRFV